MAMTTKRRRGGVPLTKTQKRIIAGTAAVAATVGGLYALYRKRKSLKAVMKPRVQKLTPEQRNGVFEKAIRDSGVACPAVTGSERTEIRPGVKGWKAQCDNDSAHLIEITPDGTAKVTSRTY